MTNETQNLIREYVLTGEDTCRAAAIDHLQEDGYSYEVAQHVVAKAKYAPVFKTPITKRIVCAYCGKRRKCTATMMILETPCPNPLKDNFKDGRAVLICVECTGNVKVGDTFKYGWEKHDQPKCVADLSFLSDSSTS